jgi:Cyclin, C-terminal domain/Cyclin, N-terminal domain
MERFADARNDGTESAVKELSSEAIRFRELRCAEDAVLQQSDYALLSVGGISDFLNPTWREKVVQWCYDVVDHLNEPRSVVYIALNFLDRYCAVISSEVDSQGNSVLRRSLLKQGSNPTSGETLPLLDERQFELASMAALLLAVRISGSGSLQLGQMTDMSRSNGINERDIMTTTGHMIKSLWWDQPLLTPFDFVELYVSALPKETEGRKTSSPQTLCRKVVNAAFYLIEISVCDRAVMDARPSNVALAAALVALESLQAEHELDNVPDSIVEFASSAAPHIDFDEIRTLGIRLDGLYRQCWDVQRVDGIDNDVKVGPHVIEDEMAGPMICGRCEDCGAKQCVGSSQRDAKPALIALDDEDERLEALTLKGPLEDGRGWGERAFERKRRRLE